jgi:hypothetical protein
MSIYAVNGKVPVAAWIPSRDTAGNGTTTLTDLVGSNNGTLTNMDAATDWVNDISNGGIRALDFDGLNDFINLGNTTGLASTAFTVSFWMRWNGADANNNRGLIGKYGSGNTRGWAIATANTDSVGISEINQPGTVVFYYQSNASTFNSSQAIGSVGTTVNNNAWRHVVCTFNPSIRTEIFIDGTSARNTTLSVPSSVASHASSAEIARYASNAATCFLGRLDDLRVFNTALNSSDIAYLYNGGNGRGRIQNNSFMMGQPI